SATSAVHCGNSFDANQPLSKHSFEALGCRLLSLGEDMQRREFITLLGGAATAWPLAARAEQAAKSYSIAYLALSGDQDALLVKHRLGELGYSEGKNLTFNFRSA